jgi:hypothetical protein
MAAAARAAELEKLGATKLREMDEGAQGALGRDAGP